MSIAEEAGIASVAKEASIARSQSDEVILAVCCVHSSLTILIIEILYSFTVGPILTAQFLRVFYAIHTREKHEEWYTR